MSTRGWKRVIRLGRLLYPLSHLAGPVFQFLRKLLGLCHFLRLSISPGMVLWSSAFILPSIRNPQGFVFDLCSYYFRLLFLKCYKLLLTPGSWSILLAKPVPLPHTNSAGIMADSEKQASESDVLLWVSDILLLSLCALDMSVKYYSHFIVSCGPHCYLSFHWNRICLGQYGICIP